MAEPKHVRRVDVGEVVLVWGNPAQAKAELRAESLQRHMERPIEQRLLAALELVLPRRDG